MTTGAPLAATDFDAFFRAVHNCDPFPWQSRLARRVSEGEWPRLLDLPTGSGKTAVLDVAVFTLALHASSGLPKVPRRIVYVVDRRTIVDQAYTRARRIRRCLLDSTDGVVVRVRQALAACSRGRIPLRVASLREASHVTSPGLVLPTSHSSPFPPSTRSARDCSFAAMAWQTG
jgi:CRISPR-associated endonuclease/helicase Cas3